MEDEPSKPLSVPKHQSTLNKDDMDLDVALGIASSTRTNLASARPTRFQPKLKHKPKAEQPDALPSTKPEDLAPNGVKTDEPPVACLNSTPKEKKKEEEEEAVKEEKPMDVDPVEDKVVREIDVFFTPPPLDEHAQLYVMQYPLRPCWRPYELNERCQEVRVKPDQSMVEVELNLDVESDNYDDEVPVSRRIPKQILTSSKAPLVAGYAVGILMGNKLHLNPIHAVVQLRPSMKHLNSSLQKKKNVTQNADVTDSSEVLNESVKPSTSKGKLVSGTSNEQNTDAEPWVPLQYHHIDSDISNVYRQKMAVKEDFHIQFSMGLYDYANSLCPGTSAVSNKAKGLSWRPLLSLPMEERFKKWLSEGPQVNRFDALMHLAPADSVEDVLKVLQKHAHLVQGLWVPQSPLRCEGFQALVRDYILLLFSKDTVIRQDQLKGLRIQNENLKRILIPLAVERSALKDWRFKEPTDTSFEKNHPNIVEEQKRAWSSREKHIKDALHGIGKNTPTMTKNSLKPSMANRTTASGNAEQGVNRGLEGTLPSGKCTMSAETREALPKALVKVFHIHKVCSLQLICERLRDTACNKSYLPKGDGRVTVAAALGASAPLSELQSIISQVAINIHGVYVLKSLGIPTIDPLRNVVINLFCAKEPKGKLKKADIVEAARIVLKREISDSECTQVLKELCVSSRGGAWVLKSGDGNPK